MQPMNRASFMSSRGAWNAAAADTIVLDHRQRSERNIPLTGVRGTSFEIALPASVSLRGGDALVLDDGRLIEIVAAPEEIAEARLPAELASDARLFARLAYHVGKAGLAVEIQARRIRFSRNDALEHVLRTMGARIVHIEAPLEPDTGAFEPPATKPAAVHDHGHHGHAHHDHDHKHGHKHEHAHGHALAHEHGPDCDTDCGHDHKQDAAHDHSHAGHKHDEHKQDEHKHDEHKHAHDHGHGHGHPHKH